MRILITLNGELLFSRYLAKSETAEKSATSVGIKIASESINNIRTVACLSKILN